jgi:hypothetical protein
MVRIAFILLILIGVFHLWRSIFLLSLQLFNGKIVNLYYWESGYEITYILSYFITLSLFLPVVWILGTLIWTSSFNLTKDFINLFLPENKLLKKFKPQLEIIKATYGSPQKFIDITAIIKQMIVNNTLSIKASNQLAGDPHEGVVKKLIIDYKYEDQPKTAEIREGLRIVIPENQPINQ